MKKFVLNKERIVGWPVEIEVPIDGGKTETQGFTAHFRLRPQSELDAHYAQGGTDVAFLEDTLVGWADADVENGGALEFSSKNKSAMIDIPYVRVGLMRAYIACTSGIKRKNSETPPASGPAAKAADPETLSKTI